jgi:uncharacterized damage-inducible protein DinB
MIKENLLAEIQNEAAATKKVLEQIPDESLSWKPHEKSMTIDRLGSHVAEIFGWVSLILDYDELDFAKFDYKPPEIKSNKDIIEIFEAGLKKAAESLEKVNDEDFKKKWTMKNGEITYFTLPKEATIRSFALSHLYHHRGQLTVYLRLLNKPVPNVYGPTADFPNM